MGWFGILVFLVFPWGLAYFLSRLGVPIDFWMPLLLSISFFSLVFNEIKTNTLTLLYKFYNRYRTEGVNPKSLARQLFDDIGFSKIRVDTTAIGYFTFDDSSHGAGSALELAPEVYQPFGKSSADEEKRQEGVYSVAAYGLLFRQMGLSLYSHKPGTIMFFKRLLAFPANLAGFVYIFPITFGYAFFGNQPHIQRLLITGGLLLFAFVLLYIAILIPYELVLGRISLKLLKASNNFDKHRQGLIRRFISNYRRLVIMLTILNILAIFIPISKGEK